MHVHGHDSIAGMDVPNLLVSCSCKFMHVYVFMFIFLLLGRYHFSAGCASIQGLPFGTFVSLNMHVGSQRASTAWDVCESEGWCEDQWRVAPICADVGHSWARCRSCAFRQTIFTEDSVEFSLRSSFSTGVSWWRILRCLCRRIVFLNQEANSCTHVALNFLLCWFHCFW